MADELFVIKNGDNAEYLYSFTDNAIYWTTSWDDIHTWESEEDMLAVIADLVKVGREYVGLIGAGGSSNPVGGVRPPRP